MINCLATCANVKAIPAVVPIDGISGPLHLSLVSSASDDTKLSITGVDLKLAAAQPLNPIRYAAFCRDKGIVKGKAEQSFHTMASTVAAEPLVPVVPEKVKYSERCCELCRDDPANGKALRLKNAFKLTMTSFVKDMCSRHKCLPVQVALLEPMFWMEVVTGTRRTTVMLGQLSLANAQAGPHEAFQGFIDFEIPSAFAIDALAEDIEFRLGNHMVCQLRLRHTMSVIVYEIKQTVRI